MNLKEPYPNSTNMFKALKIIPIALLYVITACNTQGQNVSITDLLDQKPEEVLRSKNIRFKLTEIGTTPNYMLKLYGEKIPVEAVSVLSTEYKIDWDADKIIPTISFGTVPLKSPSFLLDKNGKVLIAIAETGNYGPKGIKQADVFADNDPIDLKGELAKQWGKGKMVLKDFNLGNIYVWKSQGVTARLTIENEKFENTSKEMRNDIPQDGRHGVLTLYNGVKPAFYDEGADYFNKPDISK